MCMTFTNPFQRIPRWAFKNFDVYKVMDKTSNPNVVESPHQNYPYLLGEEHTSDIMFDSDGDIDVGLHSFVTLSDAIDHWHRYATSRRGVFKCRVPKGAKYYRGIWQGLFFSENIKVSNIVSNRLTIVEEVPIPKLA